MSIAGGVAVAQSSSTSNDDARSQTANYGTPPGAPLKRDGSLHADPKAPVVTDSAATDSSSTTTTTTSSTTWNNPPAAAPAPAAPVADTSTTPTDTAPAVDTTPAPRADRN